MTSHQPELPANTAGDPVVISNVVVDSLFIAIIGTLSTGLLALLYKKVAKG